MKKVLSVIGVCGCVQFATAQTPLAAYIDTALQNNPALKVYVLQSSVLQTRIGPARSLDDPMLYGGLMNVPVDLSLTQDMMTMKQIGVQQNFSVGKKYALKGTVAQKEYEASRFDADAQRLSLIYKVKEQYYDLYAQTKAIESTRNSLEAMKSYAVIANARYGTAQGSQQDVLKAQLELTKMQVELVRMQSMKADMIATFNALLARDEVDTVIVPSEIVFERMDVLMDPLIAYAEEHGPMLLSAKTMISKDSAAYRLAKASKIPDFNGGIWYGQRSAREPDGGKAMDMLGIQFGLTLPIYKGRKQDPLIGSSEIGIQRSQAQLEATRNEIQLMIHHALIDAEKNGRLVSLYQDQLIPQATENLHSAIIGYQQNKIDFMTLTDDLISLYTYSLMYHQAIADHLKAIAQLEMLTGKDLDQP